MIMARKLVLLIFLILAGYDPSYSEIRPPSRADILYNKFAGIVGIQPDSALKIARETYRISASDNDERGVGMAFMEFGYMYALKGINDSAKLYYKKALEIRKRNHLKEQAVHTYHKLSLLYNDLGMKDSAFYFLFEALRWSESIKDKKNAVPVYSYLGRLYLEYDDTLRAIEYLRMGATIASADKDTLNMIMVYSEMGAFYFTKDHYDTALHYFLICNKLSLKGSDDNTKADIYNNIALCYSHLGQNELAVSYYRRGLNIYIGKDEKSLIATVYLNLGSLYLDAHQTDSSLYYLLKCNDLLRETSDRNDLLKCLKYLSGAYAQKGDFLHAFDYHVQYSSLSDSLLNEDKVHEIADMQTKYQTEKKEQQIKLLDQQSRTRSAQRNFFIACAILLLVLLLLLGYYYLQRQKLARKNEEIARQRISTLLNEQEIKSYNAMLEGQDEERKRLAEDLHDRLGSMLSTVKLLFGALENKVGQMQEDNKKQFENLNHLLDEAVTEVRTVSHNLSTGTVMSFGLVEALQELCLSIDESGLIKCRLLTFGMHNRMDMQKEIGLYRMIQELVSNILKHAKASNITIQLNKTDNSLTITVEDDGIGFDTSIKSGSGIGLKNLEARAAKLGGTYFVESGAGKGTLSIIEISV